MSDRDAPSEQLVPSQLPPESQTETSRPHGALIQAEQQNNVEEIRHEPPFFYDKEEGEVSVSEFIKHNPGRIKETASLTDQIAELTPDIKDRGQLLAAIEHRLRWRGDYKNEAYDDVIFQKLLANLENKEKNTTVWRDTLMAVEALKAKEMAQQASSEEDKDLANKTIKQKGYLEDKEDIRANLQVIAGKKLESSKKIEPPEASISPEASTIPVVQVEEPAEEPEAPPVTPEPAPVQPQPEQGAGVIPLETESGLAPAPLKEVQPVGGRREDQSAPPAPDTDRAPIAPVTVAPPPVEMVLAEVIVPDQKVKNNLELATEVRGHDLQKMPRGKIVRGLSKIPLIGKPLGAAWFAIRHPVEIIWKNGFIRRLTDQQAVRFTDDFQNILKRAYGDTLPINVDTALLNKALDEGYKRQKRPFVFNPVRMFWAVTDIPKHLTGLGQLRHQHLAKEWLRKQLYETKDDEKANRRRSTNAVRNALSLDTESILTQQTKVGDRFALLGEAEEGVSFQKRIEDSNSVIDAEVGEMRMGLPKQMLEDKEGVKARDEYIKGLIQNFYNNRDGVELVTKLNEYFRDTIIPEARKYLTVEQVEGLNSSEFASNIVTIAKNISSRFADYNAPREGGKLWDKLHFNIILGKGEFSPVRGKNEMGFLSESLARRLANRSIIDRATMNGAIGLASAFADFSTVGSIVGMYLLGSSGALLGSPGKAISTVAGPLAMSALSFGRETGVRIPLFDKVQVKIGGVEARPFYWKGLTERERLRLSRDTALGRMTAEGAEIRKELMAGLVGFDEKGKILAEAPFHKATAISAGLEELLNEELNASSAEKLLARAAEADALMRLTGLTSSYDMRLQNYLQYTNGNENEEYLRLKSAFLSSITRLNAYARKHDEFRKGRDHFYTGNNMYGKKPNELGYFEELSALAEAQLRFSSAKERIRDVKSFMQREYGFSNDNGQLDALLDNETLDLKVSEEQAYVAKDNLVRKLALKRGVKAAIVSGIASVVAPTLYTSVGSVVAQAPDLLEREIFHEIIGVDIDWDGKHLFHTLKKESGLGHWRQVLRGEVPLRQDIHGQFFTDLTPLQKAVLMTHAVTEDPDYPIQYHEEVVDGVRLNLSPGLRIDEIKGNDGRIHELLVDVKTTKVIDITDYKFEVEKHDGKNELFIIDAEGNRELARKSELLKGVANFSNVITDVERAEHAVKVGDEFYNDPDFKQIKTKIPTGTEFARYTDEDKIEHINLVIKNDHHKVLLQDIQLDENGQIITDTQYAWLKDAPIQVDVSSKHVSEVGYEGSGYEHRFSSEQEAVAEWEKMGTHIDKREFWTNNTKRPDGSELRLYNTMHMTEDGDIAVKFDASKIGMAYRGDESINTSTLAKNGDLYLAFSLGGHFKEPHLLPIGTDGFVTVEPDSELGKLLLNQDKLKEYYELEIAKTNGNTGPNSEYRLASDLLDREGVFNLLTHVDGNKKPGHIEVLSYTRENGKTVADVYASTFGCGKVTNGVFGGGESNAIVGEAQELSSGTSKELHLVNAKYRAPVGEYTVYVTANAPDILSIIKPVGPFPLIARMEMEKSGEYGQEGKGGAGGISATTGPVNPSAQTTTTQSAQRTPADTTVSATAIPPAVRPERQPRAETTEVRAEATGAFRTPATTRTTDLFATVTPEARVTKEAQTVLNKIMHQISAAVPTKIGSTPQIDKEIVISSRDKAVLQTLFTMAKNRINKDPQIKQLQELQLQIENDPAFKKSRNNRVNMLLDESIKEPVIVTNSSGVPQIKTPQEDYEKWRVRNRIQTTSNILDENKPTSATGVIVAIQEAMKVVSPHTSTESPINYAVETSKTDRVVQNTESNINLPPQLSTSSSVEHIPVTILPIQTALDIAYEIKNKVDTTMAIPMAIPQLERDIKFTPEERRKIIELTNTAMNVIKNGKSRQAYELIQHLIQTDPKFREMYKNKYMVLSEKGIKRSDNDIRPTIIETPETGKSVLLSRKDWDAIRKLQYIENLSKTIEESDTNTRQSTMVISHNLIYCLEVLRDAQEVEAQSRIETETGGEYEVAARSDRGGRYSDQDSYFTVDTGFHFAEVASVVKVDSYLSTSPEEQKKYLAQVVNSLEVKDKTGKVTETLEMTVDSINNTEKLIKELIGSGKLKHFEIVADGMGGHAQGEAASSLVTYIVAREIAKAAQMGIVNESTIKDAIKYANTVLYSYSEREKMPKNGPGTTLVLSFTDEINRTFVASVGDSRVYKKEGQVVTQLTADQNMAYALATLGQLDIKDILIQKNSSRSSIINYIGQEEFNQDSVHVEEVVMSDTDSLILVCDGVWEGIDTEDPEVKLVVEEINQRYHKELDLIKSNLSLSDVDKRNLSEIALRKAFGEVFARVNLKGVINSTVQDIANHLTRSSVGEWSRDNITAVVVNKRKENTP